MRSRAPKPLDIDVFSPPWLGWIEVRISEWTEHWPKLELLPPPLLAHTSASERERERERNIYIYIWRETERGETEYIDRESERHEVQYEKLRDHRLHAGCSRRCHLRGCASTTVLFFWSWPAHPLVSSVAQLASGAHHFPILLTSE